MRTPQNHGQQAAAHRRFKRQIRRELEQHGPMIVLTLAVLVGFFVLLGASR